ncbi:(d)CMP kinase [Naasia sp. SYSU D00057]|uniref:(d)CMP kinase n=1 Tax=Naasia sp. SYSU D00057 TaxID=2817380 RepID=UPI001B30F1B0|nr:(d)CMP kinase [Naasia sp. SYSU D00057]
MTRWSRTVVAVDGPAGSGKSSVSRAAARALGFEFLDTGAAYRAIAWLGLERGVDFDDSSAVAALVDELDERVTTDPDDVRVTVGGVDVTDAIREPRVTSVVSAVARVPQVRERLNEHFRERLDAPGLPGIVAEGRDITTVVAPDASVRVLLTADESVRVQRRRAELSGASTADVTRLVVERDRKDAQVVDFMTAAEGVTTLDSTSLSFEETVDAMVALVREAAAGA